MNSAEKKFLLLALFLFALGMVSRFGFLNKLHPLETISLPLNTEFSEAAAIAEGDSAYIDSIGADANKPVKNKKYKPEFPLNINTASKEDLCFIKGIGPSTAQKIIDYRESKGNFRKAKDLEKVPGIGAKKRQAMEEFIKFE